MKVHLWRSKVTYAIRFLLPRGSWGSNSACQLGGKLLYSLSHLTGPKAFFFFKVELCRSARGRWCEFCDLTHPDEAGMTHVRYSQIVPVMQSWGWHEDICLKAFDEVAEQSTRVCALAQWFLKCGETASWRPFRELSEHGVLAGHVTPLLTRRQGNGRGA